MAKGKAQRKLDQIKYVINFQRKTMEDIIGENTSSDNPYASGILEAYRQMDNMIKRLEAQDDSNKD